MKKRHTFVELREFFADGTCACEYPNLGTKERKRSKKVIKNA
ncbi:hypothetical protein JOC94_002847 [Bacillus thermophilus]|uniref:Uncharacterized protein n=1 Tax=Siminovitchia thermophila TaxID=1245522 RepID=A0ABS2RAH1_9BACI|nr:hypothetical protein [Siminovitchia thermophila]